MKWNFMTVVVTAAVGLGIVAAGAAPAQAHDCNDGWRVSGYRADFGGGSCYRHHYRHHDYRRAAFFGDRFYDGGYVYPSYARYHARHRYYRTVPRVVTVYRTVPVYRTRRVYRRVYRRHYHRPRHRVVVYRTTTIYR